MILESNMKSKERNIPSQSCGNNFHFLEYALFYIFSPESLSFFAPKREGVTDF